MQAALGIGAVRYRSSRSPEIGVVRFRVVPPMVSWKPSASIPSLLTRSPPTVSKLVGRALAPVISVPMKLPILIARCCTSAYQ